MLKTRFALRAALAAAPFVLLAGCGEAEPTNEEQAIALSTEQCIAATQDEAVCGCIIDAMLGDLSADQRDQWARITLAVNEMEGESPTPAQIADAANITEDELNAVAEATMSNALSASLSCVSGPGAGAMGADAPEAGADAPAAPEAEAPAEAPAAE